MNRKEYNSDSRYRKVLEQMDLLGIMDVTTTRQAKNGTVVWKLPIKNNWNNGKLIEVASFSTGYVRNQNSGYSNYQLNKRQFEDEYFQAYEWKNDKQVKIPNQFRKWQRKTCILIPIEIDRLEYLISYCLKNYYIKRANEVADGKLIPKWKHEWELEQAKDKYKKLDDFYEASADFNNSMFEGMVPKWKYDKAVSSSSNDFNGHRARIIDLENKLDTIKRISDYDEDGFSTYKSKIK
jgi:hypothetical protein